MNYIYFIRRADLVGPIKIGCSNNVPRRLRALTLSVGHPLCTLSIAPGAFAAERHLKKQFAYLRISPMVAAAVGLGLSAPTEWFNPAPALLDLIHDLRAGRASFEHIQGRYERSDIARQIDGPARHDEARWAAWRFGSRRAFADAIGVEVDAVNDWCRSFGSIPYEFRDRVYQASLDHGVDLLELDFIRHLMPVHPAPSASAGASPSKQGT